jgi:hypothetical protein
VAGNCGDPHAEVLLSFCHIRPTTTCELPIKTMKLNLFPRSIVHDFFVDLFFPISQIHDALEVSELLYLSNISFFLFFSCFVTPPFFSCGFLFFSTLLFPPRLYKGTWAMNTYTIVHKGHKHDVQEYASEMCEMKRLRRVTRMW